MMNKISLNRKQLVVLIIILGIVLRLLYIIKTPITERQHDVYSIEDQGHLGYIYTIYETGRLPQTNSVQFYHPPLFHLMAAGWLRIETCLGMEFNTALEGIQILSLIFSTLIIFASYKILEKTDLKDKYKTLIISLITFHPTFIILSGSINNDVLTILLMFLTIWFLINWYEKNDLKNTIILAITVGLCVMSKLSRCDYGIPDFHSVYL